MCLCLYSSDTKRVLNIPWYQLQVAFSSLWLSFVRGNFPALFQVQNNFFLVLRIINIFMVSVLQRRTSLPHCLRVTSYMGWGFTSSGARVRSKQPEQLGGPSFWACQWEMFPSQCFGYFFLGPVCGDDAAVSEGTPSCAREIWRYLAQSEKYRKCGWVFCW